MGGSSKILLDFENNNSSTSSIQSKLIVCKNKDQIPKPIQSQPSIDSKPTISSAPKSQVLGKVKDFLGIMSESNKKLQIDARNNPEEYDIEAITGEEKEYIEFDLMLGVADLHTPEAVAAAESAISSYQPVIQLDGSDSDSVSEEESKDEDSSSDDDDDDNDGGNGGLVSKKTKRSKGNDDEGSSGEVLGNCRLKKRSKIVEIS
ncbi:hypothetical protein LguiB_028601 [Lonicera macranthoides]